MKITLFHFSCLSHLKNKASHRRSCKSRPSKPFKHFPDRTQGCLLFCTQQRIIYIPLRSLRCQCRFIAPFHRPQDFGGSIARREGEVNLTAWRWCLRARRAPRRVVSLQMSWGGPHSQPAARAQPPCPLHTQLPSLYLWFLNRHNIPKQSLYIFILFFSILFFFLLWAILPLLVPNLHRNHCFKYEMILLKNGYLCLCSP